MSLRRFPAPPLPAAPGATLALDPLVSHHALQVTRLGRGERVELYDGDRVARAALTEVAGGVAIFTLLEAPTAPAAPRPLWLLLARLKGPAFDTALRMATELGATDLRVVDADHAVPRGERADRWERVLAAAAQQCGRPGPPRLHPPTRLDAALGALPPGVQPAVCVPGAPPEGAPAGPVAVCVGPEGGWSARELQAAGAAGAIPVGLGRWVLRADTAVAAALAWAGRAG